MFCHVGYTIKQILPALGPDTARSPLYAAVHVPVASVVPLAWKSADLKTEPEASATTMQVFPAFSGGVDVLRTAAAVSAGDQLPLPSLATLLESWRAGNSPATW